MNIFLWTYIFAGLASLILSALTLISAFFVIPRLVKSKATRVQRAASWLLLLAYGLFFAVAFLCLQAFAGTLGDGSTSTRRYVNPDLLFPIGVVQLACFSLWGVTRFRSRSVAPHRGRHTAITILLLLPGLVSVSVVLKVIATTYLYFRATP